MFVEVLSVLPCQCLYIVVDTLDECEETIRLTLFRKFSRTLHVPSKAESGKLEKLKIVVSGQPHVLERCCQIA